TRSDRHDGGFRGRGGGRLGGRLGGDPHDAAVARDGQHLAGCRPGHRGSDGDADNRCRQAAVPQLVAGERDRLDARGADVADDNLGRAVAVEIAKSSVADPFVRRAARRR
ncbi:MAG: hypothetical protein ACK55I_48350, partial [bacterium]